MSVPTPCTVLPSMPDLSKEIEFILDDDEVDKIAETISSASTQCTKPTIVTKRYNWKKSLPVVSDEDHQEMLFVTLYFSKVQLRLSPLSDPGGGNKFMKFQEILRSFDPYKETPINLYKKLEILFGEQSKDLLDEFLMFLTSGQAAQVGRFLDHYTMKKMMKFTRLLHSTFSRRPTLMKKMLRTLSVCTNIKDINQVKSKVLPLLRSSPRLTQQFLQLMPDFKPVDCSYDDGDREIISDLLHNDLLDFDIIQLDDTTGTRRQLEYKHQLDTMYMQSRIFLQQGRVLRTAQVTYATKQQTQLKIKEEDVVEKPVRKTKVYRKNKKTSEITLKKDEKCKTIKDITEKKTSENWTRDEDKTILEILKRTTNTDKTFSMIKQMLPHRSLDEIRERFSHVMNLLHEMASSNPKPSQ